MFELKTPTTAKLSSLTPRIATCDDYGTGERPLFVALERAEVVA